MMDAEGVSDRVGRRVMDAEGVSDGVGRRVP
jgi:hypothetical protein